MKIGIEKNIIYACQQSYEKFMSGSETNLAKH